MRVFSMLILVLFISSCNGNKNRTVVQSQTSSANEKLFVVNEVVQATNYTYLKVNENGSERWVAVTKQEASSGEIYYYDSALQMTNFHSNDLNRDFDVIYFINQISQTPFQPLIGESLSAPTHNGKVESEKDNDIFIDKADDELTVADIYSNKNDYSEKEVEMRGIVVKVNNGVMGINWVHIQDGTSSDGNFDLTITTHDVANVNDDVTFKGKIVLDRDFTAGYFYDVIMENAILTDKKSF